MNATANAAILAADVAAAYSRLTGLDEEGTLKGFLECRIDLRRQR